MFKNIRHSSSGITLVEITILVVVLGIISAMAVPGFQRVMEKLKLSSAARDIVSDLRWARSEAISSRTQIGVYFNEIAKTYTLFVDINNPAGFTYTPGLDSVVKVSNYSNLGAASSTFTNDTIIFKTDGSSNNSGQFTCATPDSYHSRTVDVLSSTGRIKLIS
ncbi:MAG: GspH/FimT family pseudopilin [candidate division Zixibacteria bacterium]|nr:GspH/FimT family pseudopilin [candidate division Zixibacteria bacterium]